MVVNGASSGGSFGAYSEGRVVRKGSIERVADGEVNGDFEQIVLQDDETRITG